MKGSRPKVDPPARTRDGAAKDEHDQEKTDAHNVKRGRESHEVSIVQAGYHEQGHEPDADPRKLPRGERAAAASWRQRPHRQDAQGSDEERSGQQDPVYVLHEPAVHSDDHAETTL